MAEDDAVDAVALHTVRNEFTAFTKPAERAMPAAPEANADGGTPEVGSRPESRRRHAQLYQALDATIAPSLCLILLLAASGRWPTNFSRFLSDRVSLASVLLFGAILYSWQYLFTLFGLYDRRIHLSRKEEALTVVAACTLGSVLWLPLVMRHGGRLVMPIMAAMWLLTTALTLMARAGARGVLGLRRRQERRRVIIVGSGPRAMNAYRSLGAMAAPRFDVIGFVDSGEMVNCTGVHEQILGGLHELEPLLMRTVVDEVLIALPIKSCYAEIQQAIAVCERAGVESKVLADLFAPSLASPRYDASVLPVIAMPVVTDDSRLVVKRAMDIAGAACAMVVLSPLFVAIGIAIRLTSPGPALFVQERYGYRKRRFTMYKFRTMIVGAEDLLPEIEHRNEATGPIFKIRNDPRLTRLGRLLRISSLDELPQFLNVLRGDMSLVGPRPMSTRDVHLFTEPWLMRRFSVRPGITGLWQVNGRSQLPFLDWIALDLEYIDNWSLRLDASILLRTLPAVLRATGAL